MSQPFQLQYYYEPDTKENNAEVQVKRLQARQLIIGECSLYFSFEALVAVKFGTTLKVVKNYSGPAMGRHLSAIDGGTPEAKEARMEKADFDAYVTTLKIQVTTK